MLGNTSSAALLWSISVSAHVVIGRIWKCVGLGGFCCGGPCDTACAEEQSVCS